MILSEVPSLPLMHPLHHYYSISHIDSYFNSVNLLLFSKKIFGNSSIIVQLRNDFIALEKISQNFTLINVDIDIDNQEELLKIAKIRSILFLQSSTPARKKQTPTKSKKTPFYTIYTYHKENPIEKPKRQKTEKKQFITSSEQTKTAIENQKTINKAISLLTIMKEKATNQQKIDAAKTLIEFSFQGETIPKKYLVLAKTRLKK